MRRGVDEVFVLFGYYVELISSYRSLERAYCFNLVLWLWDRYPVPQLR